MTNPAHTGFTAAMSAPEAFSKEVPAVEKPFGKALLELGRSRSVVVGLTADLAKYTDIDAFGREFPERFFQVGMAEQNLVGIAAGLARPG